ncbi:hypothetical protein BP5796_04486 [Coleophoma crateriformis]|uniref:NmrA-like domain-containing protein n=1 Tax=Coleophoma crateriformis TaxID=565419 RepID=A0A3D8S9G8_9HELO|nr:hypothetical protein BP5796_04486 [Coleophoma crateriformis]
MSSSKKVLVVFGATGNQGGSVVNSILSDPIASARFHIRGITRDISKPAALALADKGVETVQADLQEKDSLRKALDNAYAVFAVTNFWEHLDVTLEVQQGKNIADVAKELNIEHLIWSGLPNVAKISNNKFSKVYHFDGKAEITDYIRTLAIPHTIVHLGIFTSFPLENLIPTSTSPAKYKLSFPIPNTASFPLIDVKADTGKYIKAILLNPSQTLGNTINLAEDWYTMDQMITVLKELGLDVVYEEVDDLAFRRALEARGLPAFIAEDVCQNCMFVNEFGYFGGEGLEVGHQAWIQLVKEPLTDLKKSVANSAIFKNLTS